MATRFPLYFNTTATPVDPSFDAGWTHTISGYGDARSYFTGVLVDEGATGAVISGSNSPISPSFNTLFKQYVSKPLTIGVIISGSQTYKMQCVARLAAALNTPVAYLTVSAKIIGIDGSLRKTLLILTRDTTPINHGTDTNRSMAGTTSAGSYTTVAGDRIVIEIGVGAPAGVNYTFFQMYLHLGYDSSAGWLPEDDTETDTDLNPWFELSDTLTFSEYVEVNAGSYSLTGQATSGKYGRKLINDVGNYTITGQDTNLFYTRPLVVDPGSYTVTGQDVNFLKTNVIDLGAGSYALAGQGVILSPGKYVSVDPGSYSLTGQDTVGGLDRAIIVDAGNYNLTGQSTELLYSGFVIVNTAYQAENNLFWLFIDENQ